MAQRMGDFSRGRKFDVDFNHTESRLLDSVAVVQKAGFLRWSSKAGAEKPMFIIRWSRVRAETPMFIIRWSRNAQDGQGLPRDRTFANFLNFASNGENWRSAGCDY